MLLKQHSVRGRLAKIASSPGQGVLKLWLFYSLRYEWGFFQPRESDDMPKWDGADETQPRPAKPRPCATWGAGAASMASLNSPIFGRKIHPVFPSRKEDLQNSLLQDQRILQPQTPDKFTQEKKHSLRTSSYMPRQSVARCPESFRKTICA